MSNKVQYGFFVDTTKCSGCKTCQIACKDRGELPVDVNWRRVYEYGGGQWQHSANNTFEQDVFSYYVSVACNHCSHPVCVKACPTGACHKRAADGLVHINVSLCIGCQSCARACPYDAPQFDQAKGVMTKCDGCFDRIEKGRLPICVDSCPLRALDFGSMEQLRQKYGENADILPLPSSSVTNPNLIIKVNVNERSDGRILNKHEV